MNRVLQAELLDTLPVHAPAARHSRRDLRWINGVMRNRAWFRRLLPRLARPGESVLEIGAGDGAFARRLNQVIRPAGLDLCPRPAGWPTGARWHQEDVRRFADWADYPVVFGNLVFHHFADEVLAELGAAIRRHARVFVACEPVRSRRHQVLFSLLCPLIGAHAVTRHDGHRSIAAGFVADELPRAMGFTVREWRCRVHTTLLGAYRLAAVRS